MISRSRFSSTSAIKPLFYSLDQLMKLQVFLAGLVVFFASGVFAAVADAPPPLLQQSQTALFTRVFTVPPEALNHLKRIKGYDAKKPVLNAMLIYFKQNGLDLKSPASVQFYPGHNALQVRATLQNLYRAEALVGKLARER